MGAEVIEAEGVGCVQLVAEEAVRLRGAVAEVRRAGHRRPRGGIRHGHEPAAVVCHREIVHDSLSEKVMSPSRDKDNKFPILYSRLFSVRCFTAVGIIGQMFCRQWLQFMNMLTCRAVNYPL